MEEKKHKISNMMAVALITVAIAFDILEFGLAFWGVGLFLNRIIVVIKWIIFAIWLAFLGVSILDKPSRLATTGITGFAGLIPVVGALPEFTIGIIILIGTTREGKWAKLMGALGVATPEDKKSKIRRFKRGSDNNKARVAKRSENENVTRKRRERDRNPRVPLNDRTVRGAKGVK